MNQYIYFSSKGNQNPYNEHSDFTVKFSNPLVIPPYAEIRCVNCRVNPTDNVLDVVAGENDTFAFSIGKFWVEENMDTPEELFQNAFPLFTVIIEPGLYQLSSGTDKNIYLNAQIEYQINRQITNIPSIRNGVSVSINANEIITVKVSPMSDYYGIPDNVNLPSDLVDKMKRQNNRVSQMSADFFVDQADDKDALRGRYVALAPLDIVAKAPVNLPPNQVGDYDVTCGTLNGSFSVGDVVNFVNADNTLKVGQPKAKILAVNAGLPTKIQILTPSEEWDTANGGAVDLKLTKEANNCKITSWDTAGPQWRGVSLNANPRYGDFLTQNICSYHVSPPVNMNSLGSWEDADEWKLASTFYIDLRDYDEPDNPNLPGGGETEVSFRWVYSAFFDSLEGMNADGQMSGFGAGMFSSAYRYYAPEKEDIYFPSVASDDRTTVISPADQDKLENYLYRVQYEQLEGEGGQLHFSLMERGQNGNFNLNSYGLKGESGEYNAPNSVALPNPEDIEVCIETYVNSGIETNAQNIMIKIKTNDDGAGWRVVASYGFSSLGFIGNNLGFHKKTSKDAPDSKKGFQANLRFAFCENAYLTEESDPTGENFATQDHIYIATAYNPIDEANGFVDGAFREADYLTASNTDLPSELPSFLFGDNNLNESTKRYITSQHPSNTVNIPWESFGDNLLGSTNANAGQMLGMDDENYIDNATTSYSDGLEFPISVQVNARDFPQHYLDLPTLPIKNVTGTALFGRPNNFICPIDLNSGSGIRNNIHTSQNETLVYNDLGNAYEERITDLRIRICDIEGTPSRNLQGYTLGCLEIRENPVAKQMKMMRALQKENEANNYQDAVRPTTFNRGQ